MKQPNPLVPQGSFESQGRRKSHVRLAVFTILAIHLVVLGALLIQGCKREEKDTTALNPPTNDMSTAVQPFTNAITDVVTTPTTAHERSADDDNRFRQSTHRRRMLW
jgi:hypothetical protein